MSHVRPDAGLDYVYFQVRSDKKYDDILGVVVQVAIVRNDEKGYWSPIHIGWVEVAKVQHAKLVQPAR